MCVKLGFAITNFLKVLLIKLVNKMFIFHSQQRISTLFFICDIKIKLLLLLSLLQKIKKNNLFIQFFNRSILLVIVLITSKD